MRLAEKFAFWLKPNANARFWFCRSAVRLRMSFTSDLSPVWRRTCTASASGVLNVEPHSWQKRGGFGSEHAMCDFLCCTRSFRLENVSLQWKHVKSSEWPLEYTKTLKNKRQTRKAVIKKDPHFEIGGLIFQLAIVNIFR